MYNEEFVNEFLDSFGDFILSSPILQKCNYWAYKEIKKDFKSMYWAGGEL